MVVALEADDSSAGEDGTMTQNWTCLEFTERDSHASYEWEISERLDEFACENCDETKVCVQINVEGEYGCSVCWDCLLSVRTVPDVACDVDGAQ